VITLFWNIVGIFSPLFIDGFYKEFTKLGGIFYANDFYDGESSVPQPIHPYVEMFTPKVTIFDYEGAIVAFLVVLGRELKLLRNSNY
jgi:hypothetical protein